MARADSHVTTIAPATPAGPLAVGVVIQQRERATALSDLARLRKEASAEITRLIAFLDASDSYVMNELEDECEDEGAQCEDEGAEHDGREPDVDDEPSLGSLDPSMSGGDQTRWAAGSRRDLELDHAESGIRDLDGLLEQIGSQDWQQGAMA